MPYLLYELRIDPRHIGADLRTDLNETPLRQLKLCFPEGRPADAQLLAKLRLVELLPGFNSVCTIRSIITRSTKLLADSCSFRSSVMPAPPFGAFAAP